MSACRIPKRQHGERMCYQCRKWKRAVLDYGRCGYDRAGRADRRGLRYAYADGCPLWAGDGR